MKFRNILLKNLLEDIQTANEIQEEYDKDAIEEISASGAAGAYLTPAAFRGNGEAAKQKQRRSATTSGYTMVNRPDEEGDDVSPQKDPHSPVSFGKKGN